MTKQLPHICLFLLLLLGLHQSSCSQNQENKAPQNKKPAHSSILKSIAAKTKVQPLPVKDSISWKPESKEQALSKEQIKKLAIDHIILKHNQHYQPDSKITVLYQLNLSNNFYSFVFSYAPGEHEVYHHLATYSKKTAALISSSKLASEDIAEGLFSSFSIISKTLIQRHDFNYTNEKQPESITQYRISPDGKLIESK